MASPEERLRRADWVTVDRIIDAARWYEKNRWECSRYADHPIKSGDFDSYSDDLFAAMVCLVIVHRWTTSALVRNFAVSGSSAARIVQYASRRAADSMALQGHQEISATHQRAEE